MPQFSLIPTGDVPEIAEDVRALFEELAESLAHDQRAWSGKCQPPVDVLETDEAVEVAVDVAGVRPEAIRVAFRAGVLIIAGEKAPPAGEPHQAFHLIEREFGRFARAVRLGGAYDVAAARAVIENGELLITLPKRSERRGRAQRIPVHARSSSHS